MSQSLIAKCPKCNDESLYKGQAKRPRITCSKCGTRFYITTPKTQNHSNDGRGNDGVIPSNIKNTNSIPKQNPPLTSDIGSSINDNSWFEMDDPELTRHTYRRIILSNESSIREKLEASRCLDALSKNVGKLDITTDEEIEQILRNQSPMSLVNQLKKNWQEEL